jgi:sec-independent protein translocase protein TatC
MHLPESEKDLPILDHLEELRWVLIRSLIAVVILLPLAFWAAQPVINYMVDDCAPEGFTLQYFKLMEPFLTKLKVAIILTLFIAFPYIAWQFWRFAVPGLYNRERRVFGLLAMFSWILFVIGVAFGYLVILPFVVQFSLSFENPQLRPLLGLADFISLTVLLLLAFGLIFQLPIAVIALVRAGIVSKATLRHQRPIIVIVIAVLSALLTPPDVISQISMIAPTYCLFELSLLFSREPASSEDELELVNVQADTEF